MSVVGSFGALYTTGSPDQDLMETTKILKSGHFLSIALVEYFHATDTVHMTIQGVCQKVDSLFFCQLFRNSKVNR